MTRNEFIKAWVGAVDAGRLRNFPDMKLSERVCAQVGDEQKAKKMWLKCRSIYLAKTVEDFNRELAIGRSRTTTT